MSIEKRAEPRKSYLRVRGFVPKKGDLFDNLEGGFTLECVSTNHFIDPRTGTSVKYGLLVGFSQQEPDVPLTQAFVEDDPEAYLGTKLERDAGGGIQQIRRIRPQDGQPRMYTYSAKEGDFVFVPQD